MKLIVNVLITTLLTLLISLSVQAEEKDTAGQAIRKEMTLLTVEATVKDINKETREITLINDKGESESFTLDEDAGQLDDIDKGDRISVEYLEAVTIHVFGADEIKRGSDAQALIAETPAGEKPAAMIAEQVSLVVTIEDIDLENELVTLKNKDGETKTVSPKYPENLKKVKVGDKVKITYTTAVGFSVTEKPKK